MAPPIEKEQLRVEAAQLAMEAIQIQPFVKWGKIYRRRKVSALRNRLDERAYVQQVVTMLGLNRLNRYELTHVKALIFYISRNQGIQEELLIKLLGEEFKVGKIENVRRKDYERVVDFLRDIIKSDDELVGRQ